MIVILGFIYFFLSIYNSSSLLLHLVIDCIPSAIVAISVIPAAYVFLYKHGLTLEQQLHQLFQRLLSVLDTQRSTEEPPLPDIGMTMVSEQATAIFEEETAEEPEGHPKIKDALIVVDVQNDFIDGTLSIPRDSSRLLLRELPSAIKAASHNGMLVVFTRDWHPPDHWSFKENRGPHNKHCVRGTSGAEIHSDIELPHHSVMIDFGTKPKTRGYTPFENPAMKLLLDSKEIETIYVAGIALEYCVKATCLGAVKLGKQVRAIEPLIGNMGQQEGIDEAWRQLVEKGIERCVAIPDELLFHG